MTVQIDRQTYNLSMYLPNKPKITLFKTKGTGNIVREPLEHTGNESTPDTHIAGSGQDIKIQNDKYMSFEMNMLIIYYVHHLSTEIESRNLKNA